MGLRQLASLPAFCKPVSDEASDVVTHLVHRVRAPERLVIPGARHQKSFLQPSRECERGNRRRVGDDADSAAPDLSTEADELESEDVWSDQLIQVVPDLNET